MSKIIVTDNKPKFTEVTWKSRFKDFFDRELDQGEKNALTGLNMSNVPYGKWNNFPQVMKTSFLESVAKDDKGKVNFPMYATLNEVLMVNQPIKFLSGGPEADKLSLRKMQHNPAPAYTKGKDLQWLVDCKLWITQNQIGSDWYYFLSRALDKETFTKFSSSRVEEKFKTDSFDDCAHTLYCVLTNKNKLELKSEFYNLVMVNETIHNYCYKLELISKWLELADDVLSFQFFKSLPQKLKDRLKTRLVDDQAQKEKRDPDLSNADLLENWVPSDFSRLKTITISLMDDKDRKFTTETSRYGKDSSKSRSRDDDDSDNEKAIVSKKKKQKNGRSGQRHKLFCERCGENSSHRTKDCNFLKSEKKHEKNPNWKSKKNDWKGKGDSNAGNRSEGRKFNTFQRKIEKVSSSDDEKSISSSKKTEGRPTRNRTKPKQ